MLRCLQSCHESGCGQPSVRGSRYCEKHVDNNLQLEAERVASRERKRALPWSGWYDRWPWTGLHGLRATTLAKDPICKACNRAPSRIADHITPHRGDYNLFCDEKNLQGLCEACHNEKSARELATLGPHAGHARITWRGPAAAQKNISTDGKTISTDTPERPI